MGRQRPLTGADTRHRCSWFARCAWVGSFGVVLLMVGDGSRAASTAWAAQSQPARLDRRDFSIPILRCPADGPSVPSVDGYLLSTAPVGEYIDASQLTQAAICYSDAGVEVVFQAVERNTFSTAAECMAPVWEHGCAMELFIAPVHDRWDVPSEYQEIDGAPSGAIWGSCINSAEVCPGCANATEPTCAIPGAYECVGEELGRFTNGVVGEAEQTGDGWLLRLSLPWSIFAEWARPASSGAGSISPWPHWRLNLYRYNFFQGTAPDDYELDAWSPAHSPTFHDPRRFGYARMGDEPDIHASASDPSVDLAEQALAPPAKSS